MLAKLKGADRSAPFPLATRRHRSRNDHRGLVHRRQRDRNENGASGDQAKELCHFRSPCLGWLQGIALGDEKNLSRPSPD